MQYGNFKNNNVTKVRNALHTLPLLLAFNVQRSTLPANDKIVECFKRKERDRSTAGSTEMPSGALVWSFLFREDLRHVVRLLFSQTLQFCGQLSFIHTSNTVIGIRFDPSYWISLISWYQIWNLQSSLATYNSTTIWKEVHIFSFASSFPSSITKLQHSTIGSGDVLDCRITLWIYPSDLKSYVVSVLWFTVPGRKSSQTLSDISIFNT